MIEVKDLNFSIQGQQILKKISTKIPSGSLTAILGPNGCGKSTLLSHIIGERKAKEQIQIRGVPVEEIKRREFAKRVAMIKQQTHFLADSFLVEDIILMGRYPYKRRFFNYSRHDHQIVEQMMEKLGVLGLKGKALKHLSGGERQRIFIAKALAQEPELLLLDEPTNHLDIQYKIALMKELTRFEGTVVIVLHDISLAAQFCDYIILMKEGEIFAQGPMGEVLTVQNLKDVFNVSFYHAEHNQKTHLYY